MIKILSGDVVNKIAAGEVVERPSSVLKELLENSLDANARNIKIYIKNAGIDLIKVADDGEGIEKEDFEKIFLKHATSKISQETDLEKIISFGFRGEALASISSVSRVVLKTHHKNDENGSEIIFENDKISSIKPSEIISGTEIEVQNLFEKIPVRKKFLKSNATEQKYIVEVFTKFLLSNPDVSFYLNIDGKEKNYPKTSLISRFANLTNQEEKNLIPISYDGLIKISGFVLHPKIFLRNKNIQYMFVNQRPITDHVIYKAITDGFDTFLMKNQFPGFLIFISLPPNLVDVNVHPRKTEVRFINSSDIYKAVKNAVNVNLTNQIRKQTLQKISNDEEVDKKRISEVEETYQLNQINEPSHKYKSDAAKEFEDFLQDKQIINSQKLSKTDPKLPNSSSNNPTSQAILFNQEISDTKICLTLDLENATQIFNSYIITNNKNSLLIIDQHAASERFYYENFLRNLKNKKINSKVLLFPEVVELSESEIKIIEESKSLFSEMGFDFDLFSDNEIRFTKVPDFVRMENFSKIIEKIIDEILINSEILNVKEKILHEIAAMLACHTAVRFGNKLNRKDIENILINLSKCENPYNCPHGRPIIQEFSTYDIEKKFKRCGI